MLFHIVAVAIKGPEVPLLAARRTVCDKTSFCNHDDCEGGHDEGAEVVGEGHGKQRAGRQTEEIEPDKLADTNNEEEDANEKVDEVRVLARAENVRRLKHYVELMQLVLAQHEDIQVA